MAYDEGLAELMRTDLGDLPGLSEIGMFGGLCFLQHGNMICGVHGGGAIYRVGKQAQDAAMAIEGAGPMRFTGRTSGGMIEVTDAAMADDARRAEWTRMALAFVAGLPPKPPKKPK